MDAEQTVALLQRQIRAAQDAGPDATQLKAAVDYYYGRPRGDELPGRSAVQSLDVADMTHGIMAQILPTFVGDTVCSFEPDAPNDEAQARLETDAVNKVMMESSRGFVEVYAALKNALLLKNAIGKAWLEESGGRRMIRVAAVDPTAFVVGPDTDGVLLEDASFCAERKCYTRGELVAMGFPKDEVARVPQEDSFDNQATDARQRQGIEPADADAGWANEEVDVWECYTQLPEELDSATTSLHRCLLGGSVLLLKEKAEFIPYAAGAAFLEPHKFWGLSLYDRLKTVQDAKTAIMRQWLDNLANCNNNRTLANENVNRDDLVNARPGGVVRVKGTGPVSDNAVPLPTVDVGPAAQTYLAYMDQVRADRGGAALQMANAEAQLVGAQVGSMGVDRVMSVQEALSGMIARTFAETFLRSLFMLVHRLLRTELDETLMLRLADQWVEVDPRQFRPRVRVNIKAGLSPGERARKSANLAQVVGHQMTALSSGLDGVLVTLPNLYNALLDWGRSADVDGIESYFADPMSQASQQASQAKGQQAEQQQAMAIQLEQMKAQMEAQKLELDKYKHDTELQFKYWEARLDAETEEAKLVGGAAASLELESVRGRNQLAALAQGSGDGAAGAGRDRNDRAA